MKKELGILLLALIAAVGFSGAAAAQPMGTMHGTTHVNPMYGHNMYGHHIIIVHHHYYKHYYWKNHHRYWYWAMR